MKKLLLSIIATLLAFTILTGMSRDGGQTAKDSANVNRQQAQLAKVQPIPFYDWSLERHLLIQLYNMRNIKAITHSVWRSDRGMIEGDCASIGFGLPYDTSLTNPLKGSYYKQGGTVVVEQPEPNGVFASKNTAATWVLCTGVGGNIEPVYVETKVTTYPYPVSVNYETNRVKKAGKATVTITNK